MLPGPAGVGRSPHWSNPQQNPGRAPGKQPRTAPGGLPAATGPEGSHQCSSPPWTPARPPWEVRETHVYNVVNHLWR
jgi:hypothetical protein